MKLYTFLANGKQRLGVERGDQLIDLPLAYWAMNQRVSPSPGLPAAILPNLLQLVSQGNAGLEAARLALAFAAKRPPIPAGEVLQYPIAAVKILAPIPRPGKILCSGINYRSHQQENPKATLPSEPFFFSKLPSAVIGPGEPIKRPRKTQQMDYEVELAVVIGELMKETPESEVMSCIFGYTILHDVSARDVQFKDNQITLGKNFDGFCPLGPCIVTRDELSRPDQIYIRSFVNGELRQNGSTQDWLFSLPVLLNRLSQVMTLEPGDIVSTGTPAGVGAFKNPPRFLNPGDVVRLEIEGIGSLENTIV